MRITRRDSFAALSALGVLAVGLWNLAGPPMWWDEGWTLSVARNWIERGHYGRLLAGALAPPGLEAALPVTGPIALLFRLLGVGIWQGRLFGVLCLAGALLLFYWLAARLYSSRVALGMLLVLMLTPMHPQLHPLIMARQVLGEMPLFLYLLAGYACYYHALRSSGRWLGPAILFWGIGIVTKIQALPFWALSLALPIVVALAWRRWRTAALTAGGLAGTLLIWVLFPLFRNALLQGQTLPVEPISGLYDVTAVVLTRFNRLYAARMLALLAVPTLLALGHAAARQLRPAPGADVAADTLRWAMLGLSASWMLWYALLSVGVPRYMFPATFFGSMFVAAWLHDLTGGFDLPGVLRRASLLVRGVLSRQVAAAWLVIALLALTMPITLLTLNRYYLRYTDTSAQQAASYLTTALPPEALIETYESELHFLLSRRYHFPPDQLHVDLNQRSLLHKEVQITYDPLASGADYLVVGQFASDNRLYQPAIDRGDFQLIQTFGMYRIYRRVGGAGVVR